MLTFLFDMSTRFYQLAKIIHKMQSRKFCVLYEIFKNISYSFPIIKRKDSTDYGNDFENNKPLQIFQRANSRKQHIHRFGPSIFVYLLLGHCYFLLTISIMAAQQIAKSSKVNLPPVMCKG